MIEAPKKVSSLFRYIEREATDCVEKEERPHGNKPDSQTRIAVESKESAKKKSPRDEDRSPNKGKRSRATDLTIR